MYTWNIVKMSRVSSCSCSCYRFWHRTSILSETVNKYKNVEDNHMQNFGYGLDDRGSEFRFQAGGGNVSLRHRIQPGSGAQPAPHPMGIGDLSPGVKRPGREADHSPPSSAEVKEWVELYLHSPIRLHGVVLSKSTGTTLPLPSLALMDYALWANAIRNEWENVCKCISTCFVHLNITSERRNRLPQSSRELNRLMRQRRQRKLSMDWSKRFYN
jgi:hypothetical protein